MLSLDLIVSFASAARHRGFASAARALGVSPSSVAKNVARLESELGVRLFHRTTRQVALSQDGEALYERCRRILEDVESLRAGAASDASQPGGTLRLDMPVTYGRQVVLPILAKLLDRYPTLKLDARFSDQVSDLVKEGLDAAIRLGPLADSGLVARMFDQQPIVTCAGATYLRRHGTPRSPQELDERDCLLFRLPTSGRDRPWQFRSGKRDYSVLPKGGVRLGDGEALVEAALAGLGITQVPLHMARSELDRGRLVEILHAYRPAPLAVSLVYPSHHHLPARVRVLAEALVRLRASRGPRPAGSSRSL